MIKMKTDEKKIRQIIKEAMGFVEKVENDTEEQQDNSFYTPGVKELNKVGKTLEDATAQLETIQIEQAKYLRELPEDNESYANAKTAYELIKNLHKTVDDARLKIKVKMPNIM